MIETSLDHSSDASGNPRAWLTCLTNKIKAVLPYGLQVPNVHENRLVRFYLAGYVRDNRESIELEYSIDPKTRLVESEPKMNMFRPDVGYFVGIGRNVVVSKAINGGIPELKKNEAINTLLSRTAHGTLSL